MTKRKTVLITGASAGIGAAAAKLAAERGYDVGIGWRTDQTGAETVAQEVEAAGGKSLLLQGDTSNPDDLARIFANFDETMGPMDAFVNNAGIVGQAERTEDFTPERLARIIGVNLTGAILASGLAVKRMAKRYGGNGGTIVHISSAAARLGAANLYADYAAAKGGIDTFTTGLANENADEGIRVCGIRPGIIDTAIHGKGGQPDRAREFAHVVPMKRAGSALEVAEVILWLMSDAASYVTGTTIDVSGGR